MMRRIVCGVPRYAAGKTVLSSRQSRVREETHYRVMRLLENNPRMSQRELASALGISLGSANYCLKALVEKGWLKIRNFSYSRNKRAYSYLLTSRGLSNKARLTREFLRRKVVEYEALKLEIEEIRREMGDGQQRADADDTL